MNEEICYGKSAGKNIKMNKTSQFRNTLFYLFLTQHNQRLNSLVHLSGENVESKWSLFY